MMEFGRDEMDPDSPPRYGSRAVQAMSAGNTQPDGRGFVGQFVGGARTVHQAHLAELSGRLRRFGCDGSSLP
jgi:hypothetical protein